VQRGLRARGLPPFAYASRLEQRIYHFQRLLVQAMSGRKVKLPQPSA
jgi:hypothetical protein